jgi:hypothetical protein
LRTIPAKTGNGTPQIIMFKKGKNNPPMEIPGQTNPAALQVDLAPLTVTGLAGSSVQDKKCFKVSSTLAKFERENVSDIAGKSF